MLRITGGVGFGKTDARGGVRSMFSVDFIVDIVFLFDHFLFLDKRKGMHPNVSAAGNATGN